jgi:hypothetical protein
LIPVECYEEVFLGSKFEREAIVPKHWPVVDTTVVFMPQKFISEDVPASVAAVEVVEEAASSNKRERTNASVSNDGKKKKKKPVEQKLVEVIPEEVANDDNKRERIVSKPSNKNAKKPRAENVEKRGRTTGEKIVMEEWCKSRGLPSNVSVLPTQRRTTIPDASNAFASYGETIVCESPCRRETIMKQADGSVVYKGRLVTLMFTDIECEELAGLCEEMRFYMHKYVSMITEEQKKFGGEFWYLVYIPLSAVWHDASYWREHLKREQDSSQLIQRVYETLKECCCDATKAKYNAAEVLNEFCA